MTHLIKWKRADFIFQALPISSGRFYNLLTTHLRASDALFLNSARMPGDNESETVQS